MVFLYLCKKGILFKDPPWICYEIIFLAYDNSELLWKGGVREPTQKICLIVQEAPALKGLWSIQSCYFSA